MAIMASAKGNSFEPISEGVHIGVCSGIIDIGDQGSEIYSKSSRKVMLTWELPDETVKIDGEDKPRYISKEYTLSLSEKAVLRQHLEAWRGKKFTDEELKGFDLRKVLGVGCQIQVIHNDRGYANIASIMSLPKGMPSPKPSGEMIYFDLTEPGCLTQMDKLPGWIADKIKKSATYQEIVDAQADTDGDGFIEEDDEGTLPF